MRRLAWLGVALSGVLSIAACESSSNAPPPAGSIDSSRGLVALDGFTVSGTAPLGAVSSAGAALVVWSDDQGVVKARAASSDGTWAGNDEPVGADAGEAAGAIVATASGFVVATGRFVGAGAEVRAIDRDANGQWQPPVALGAGDTGWWQDPAVPQPFLVNDSLGLTAFWPAPGDGGQTSKAIQSAFRAAGAWQPAVTVTAGQLVDAYALDDGSAGVLIASLPMGTDSAVDGALVHAAAQSWTLAGTRPVGSFSDVWGQGGASRVAALHLGDTGSPDDNGAIRYVELGANGPPPPDVDLNRVAPYTSGVTFALKTLSSGQVAAVYGFNDWNDAGGATFFQVRAADGSWSTPWSLPERTLAAAVGADGNGWTIVNTQAAFTDFNHTTAWQLRLRRFSVAGAGSVGPDLVIAEGPNGGLPTARLTVAGDRVLVVGTYLVSTAAPNTFDENIFARWFQATP